MPVFTGSLTDLGLDPRPGKVPYLKFTVQRMGVGTDGKAIAGSTTVNPSSDGTFTVTLASTIGLTPNTLVKMTGGWLGDDSFFELPPFQVPETDGTFFDLMINTGAPVSGVYGYGFGPPPDYFNGSIWFDISGPSVLMYPRES